MKIEPHISRRVIKNALLSLFIYALPIVLMLAAFYFKGARPWINTAEKTSEHPLK